MDNGRPRILPEKLSHFCTHTSNQAKNELPDIQAMSDEASLLPVRRARPIICRKGTSFSFAGGRCSWAPAHQRVPVVLAEMSTFII